MDSWRNVWRNGFLPGIANAGLLSLREALRRDDLRLIQGATTTPHPLQCTEDWPVEACDAVSYCGWQGQNLRTVGEVEEFFARTCYEADQLLGEPAACRWFLNWYDDAPRDRMRSDLLGEVERALAIRGISRQAWAECVEREPWSGIREDVETVERDAVLAIVD